MRALFASLIFLPLAASAAPRHYTPAELGQTLRTAQAQDQKDQLLASLSRGDWPGLHVHLNGALAKAAQEPLVSEYLLRETLIALRQTQAPADIAARVAELTAYETQALTPPADPDHGRGHWIPALDVAAAARGTLRAWDRRDNAAIALDLISTSPDRIAGFADADALADAIGQTSPAALENLRPFAKALPTRALAALARQLESAELYLQLFGLMFDRPAEPAVLAAIEDAARLLPAQEARRVLEQAASHPELVSAATLALAQIPGSGDVLLRCLGDPMRGGSCAQGLARHPDAVSELAELIAQGRDDLASRRALLALLWMPESAGGAGRASLSSYADNPAMPAALRAEVAGWLR